MSSPAEMPHADEALKSLVVRFKANASEAFIELASALLARGHASEALRVAEHGLQMVPDSVDGRVERAASLLALGRPRVAYVELRRALAIDPTNRRGMRLLGKAFRDAGAPHRAAQLLAKRSMNDDLDERPTAPRTSVPAAEETQPAARRPAPPPEPEPELEHDPEPEPPRPQAAGAIPGDLFSSLTQDLGLGSAVPEAPVRRVEVTQIIRRKGLPRPPRSKSELVAIDGPIVDTTQPGQLVETQNMEEPEIGMNEPAPLFDRAQTDQFSIAPFALDDEPLFQEDMPFEVRPVEGGGDEPASRAPTVPSKKKPKARKKRKDDTEVDEVHQGPVGDTLVDFIEPTPGPLEQLHGGLEPPALAPAVEKRPVPGGAVLETKRRRQAESPSLEVVDAKPKQAHVILAVVSALAIVLYMGILFYATYDDMKKWFSGVAKAPVEELRDAPKTGATARRAP